MSKPSINCSICHGNNGGEGFHPIFFVKRKKKKTFKNTRSLPAFRNIYIYIYILGIYSLCLPFILDAEYAYTLKVDEKSDVYSFGVVLLELITGRRPVGEFGEGVDIVQWTKRITNCDKNNIARIVDSRLSTVPINEVIHVFFIAMLCIHENSVERPTMREVVQMLFEFPHHASENQSPSSSAPRKEDSLDKGTNYYELFPDLLTS